MNETKTTHNMKAATQFITGKNYVMQFITNSDLKVVFQIVRRTEKSVWIRDNRDNNISRNKIKVYNEEEYIMPYGTYSMAPVLNSKREVA